MRVRDQNRQFLNKKALLRFELRISCLLDRRFNQLSHRATHNMVRTDTGFATCSLGRLSNKAMTGHAMGMRSASESLCHYLPGGLVVRIRRSHRRGRGSIPRLGILFLFASKVVN